MIVYRSIFLQRAFEKQSMLFHEFYEIADNKTYGDRTEDQFDSFRDARNSYSYWAWTYACVLCGLSIRYI